MLQCVLQFRSAIEECVLQCMLQCVFCVKLLIEKCVLQCLLQCALQHVCSAVRLKSTREEYSVLTERERERKERQRERQAQRLYDRAIQPLNKRERE